MDKKLCLYLLIENKCRMLYKCPFQYMDKITKYCKLCGNLEGKNFFKQSSPDIKPNNDFMFRNKYRGVL